MKYAKISPGILNGSVMVPPSKSVAHRAIICASLASGACRVSTLDMSDDMKATIGCMEALGLRYSLNNGVLTTSSIIKKQDNILLDAFESGSTLRFLIPIALALYDAVTFTGHGRLVSRPLEPYYDIFKEQGINYSTTNGILPLTVNKGLRSGKFCLPGNVSSQFVTGLLFALPLLTGNSSIELSTPLESVGYVDLTLDILAAFGIEIEHNNYNNFSIRGSQSYKPCDYLVEADYSQAAFWLVAGAIGNRVSLNGLNKDSKQGDAEIIDIIRQFGGRIEYSASSIAAVPCNTHGITIDVSQIPDLVPILAVLAAFSEGETRIINAARLRIKESDRLEAITEGLNKMGARVTQLPDALIINGVCELKGAQVDSYNDHRIAMALSIAATRAKGDTIIKNSGSINKSYPNFYKDFAALGGIVNEFDVG